MTDLAKLLTTFSDLNIPFKVTNYDELQGVDYAGEAEYNTRLKIENGCGYFDFYCDFYFLDGKFQCHGVWE
jgi:hypothetical protein